MNNRIDCEVFITLSLPWNVSVWLKMEMFLCFHFVLCDDVAIFVNESIVTRVRPLLILFQEQLLFRITTGVMTAQLSLCKSISTHCVMTYVEWSTNATAIFWFSTQAALMNKTNINSVQRLFVWKHGRVK